MNQPPLPDGDRQSGDPLAELTQRMQQLRHNSGKSYERMARDIYRSKTVLYMADKGVRVPGWDVLSDYVRACGGDPGQLAELEPVWRAAANQRPVPRQRTSVRPARPAPGEAVDPATYVRLLDQLRASAGLTLRSVSEDAGLAKSTLSDWRNGKRLWPRHITERYLRACHLDDVGVQAWLAVYDRLDVAPEPARAPTAPVHVAAGTAISTPATSATASHRAPPRATGPLSGHRLAWAVAVLVVVTVLIAVLKTA